MTYDTKDAADAWLSKTRTALGDSTWIPPDAPKTEPARVWTFAEWAGEVMKAKRAKLKPKTLADYERWLDKYLMPAFGGVPLGQITPDMVTEWHSGLAPDHPERHTGETLRASVYRLLSSIMNQAVKAKPPLLEDNPCQIDSAADPPEPELRDLPTPREIANAADAMPEAYRLTVLLAAYCALRSGEVRALQRRDIDLRGKQAWLRVRRNKVGQVVGTPKTRTGRRTVPIPSGLVPVVKAHLADNVEAPGDAWLFEGPRGGPLAESTFNTYWREARGKAGIGPGDRDDEDPGVDFHSLRRWWATYAQVEAGATDRQVMEQLGQTSLAVVKRYVRDVEAKRHEISEAVAGLLEDAAPDRETSV
ncbi:MAG: site-specific integrase [Micrococcales bacterium]|nr:site-specific integrase [Micrococcales bacterium]